MNYLIDKSLIGMYYLISQCLCYIDWVHNFIGLLMLYFKKGNGHISKCENLVGMDALKKYFINCLSGYISELENKDYNYVKSLTDLPQMLFYMFYICFFIK